MWRYPHVLKLRLWHNFRKIESDQLLVAALALFVLVCSISLGLYVTGVKRGVVSGYGNLSKISDSLINPEKYKKQTTTSSTSGSPVQPSGTGSSSTPSGQKKTTKNTTLPNTSSDKLSRIVVGNLGLYNESYLGVCQYRTQVTIFGSYSSVTLVEEVFTIDGVRFAPEKYGPYNKTTKLVFSEAGEQTYKNSNKVELLPYEALEFYMSLKVLGPNGENLKEDTLAFDCHS